MQPVCVYVICEEIERERESLKTKAREADSKSRGKMQRRWESTSIKLATYS
jgi:hypothetical protein